MSISKRFKFERALSSPSLHLFGLAIFSDFEIRRDGLCKQVIDSLSFCGRKLSSLFKG